MAEQRGFVDFNVGLGDTGQDNASSIQPYSTGEVFTQATARRSPENLRERTEQLREATSELQYYRDYSHLMIEYTGGTITWNGTDIVTNGVIDVTTGTFTLAPMLAPSGATKGSLSIGTPGTDEVTYTITTGTYATEGANAITVEHRDGGAAASLSATISEGPVKRILVVFDSTNTAHDASAVATAVTAAVAGDSGDYSIVGKVTVTTDAVASNTVAASAETRIEGTADDEAHVIQAADIKTLTTATPLSPGMGVAIWYRYVVEPGNGGRSESSVDRGTSAVPLASLFVTDSDPDKIPGAIPICRVAYNGQLVWYDGTRMESGETFAFESTAKQITDAIATLSSTLLSGTGTLVGINSSFSAAIPTAVGLGGIGTGITTLADALTKVDTALIRKRGFTAVLTDGSNTQGGDYNAATAADVLFDSTYAQGGTFMVRQGTYTLTASINPPSTHRPHVLGENVPEEAAVNTVIAIPAGETAHKKLKGRWENIDFITGSATFHYIAEYYKPLEFYNCRIPMGSLETVSVGPYKLVAVDCDFHGNNSHAGAGPELVIGSPAYFKRCTFGAPSVSATTILQINPSTTIPFGNIVFEECDFTVSGTPANTGFNVIEIDDSGGGEFPVIFKNCNINITATNHVATLIKTTTGHVFPVIFENCYIFSQSGGLVDNQGGNITFKDCKLVTGDGAISTYLQAFTGYGPTGTANIPFKITNCELVLGTKSVESAGSVNTNDWAMVEIGGRQKSKSGLFRIQYFINHFQIRYSAAVTHQHAASSIVFWSDGTASGNDPEPVIRDFEFNSGNIPAAVSGSSRGTASASGGPGGPATLIEILGADTDTTRAASRISIDGFRITCAGDSDSAGPTDARGVLLARETTIKDLKIQFIAGATGTIPLQPAVGAVIRFVGAEIDGLNVKGFVNANISTTYFIALQGIPSGGSGDARMCVLDNAVFQTVSWPNAATPVAMIGLNSLSEIRNSSFTNVVRGATSPLYVLRSLGSGNEYITIDNCLISNTSSSNNDVPAIYIDDSDVVKIKNNNLVWNTTTGITAIQFVSSVTACHVVDNNVINKNSGVMVTTNLADGSNNVVINNVDIESTAVAFDVP